jgi:hypothetical protein
MPFDGKEFTYTDPSEPAALAFQSPAKTRWMQAITLWSLATGVFGKQAFTIPAYSPENSEVAAVQLLRSARAMIEREEMWVQGRYNARGGRHCAVGALRAVGRFYDGESLRLAHALLHNIAHSRGFDSVEKMNDASTHDQVLTAFTSAIVSAEVLASSRIDA